jgi:hypothetical protein
LAKNSSFGFFSVGLCVGKKPNVLFGRLAFLVQMLMVYTIFRIMHNNCISLLLIYGICVLRFKINVFKDIVQRTFDIIIINMNSFGVDVWDILKETDIDPNNLDNVILIYSGISVNAAQEHNKQLVKIKRYDWDYNNVNLYYLN